MSARFALVVDDHPTNLLLASTLLKKLGWLVSQANCGEKALEIASTTQFDLILLDISMPGLSGEDTCSQLRALASPPGRIIAYTAHAFPEDRDHLLAKGFDEILVKPVSRQGFEEIIGPS